MTDQLPNHRERQFMQHLRGSGWVKRSALPDSAGVVRNLLAKGWIEHRIDSDGLFYRMTESGLAAKMAPIALGLKAKGKQ